MSKAVKTIASIALPIIGTIVAPGIGTYLGSTLSAATTAAIGGAVGGAAGGAIKGGGAGNIIKGAALGGAGGYLSGGGLTDLGITGPGSVLGEAAGSPAAGGVGPTEGSGVIGAATRTASEYLPSSILSGGSSVLPAAVVGGNVISGVLGANAADKAAKLQYQSTQDALAQQKEFSQPYVNAGTEALSQYKTLLSDPKAQTDFIQNNPFYSSLAEDAKRRLLATQASSGKIASGGTANALQTQLLTLGNGLLQGQLTNLQNTANTGANVATGTASNNSNLITSGGTAQSAGTIGAYNAGNSAYQNTINSLLALQKLKQPNVNVYSPYSLNS